MRNTYTRGHRLISLFLLINLFLQNCNGVPIAPVSTLKLEEAREGEKELDREKELIKHEIEYTDEERGLVENAHIQRTQPLPSTSAAEQEIGLYEDRDLDAVRTHDGHRVTCQRASKEKKKEKEIEASVEISPSSAIDMPKIAKEDVDPLIIPLHLAARNIDLEEVQRLLTEISDINAVDQYGWTALHHVIASAGDEESMLSIIKLLLDSGANIDAVDNDSKTPLDHAIDYDRAAIIELLKEKGGHTGKELEANVQIPFVSHSNGIPNLPEDAARIKLANDILAVTGAEPDVRLNVYYKLQRDLEKHFTEKEFLRAEWNDLWNSLKEPELLVTKDAYKYRQVAFNQQLADQVFNKLEGAKQRIQAFQSSLAENFAEHAEWIESLEQVAQFYEKFRKEVTDVWSDAEQFYTAIERKALLMGEWWPGYYYRIPQSLARYIIGLDEHKDKAPHVLPKTEEIKSNHRVSCLPAKGSPQPAVYFKSNGHPPLNPSKEYMLYSLYNQLGIEVPASGLLMLDHVRFGDNYHEKPFVLQASQAVVGRTGKTVLQENDAIQLEPKHFTKQIIGTLLTGPVDGKPDNFVVTPIGREYGWTGIDNDEVFQAPLRNGRVYFKSVLLLLSEISQIALPESVRNMLSYLHPSMLLLSWLVDLQAQQTRYDSFKNTVVAHTTNLKYPREGGVWSVGQIKDLWQELRLPFMDFVSSIIPTISYLVDNLQSYLKDNRGVTLSELFACCYPRISCFYNTLQEQVSHQPYQALKELYADEAPKLSSFQLEINSNQNLKEEDYFKAEGWHGAMSIGDRINLHLKQTKSLQVDQIIKSYIDWLQQEKDPLEKQFICQQALKSLQILQHYGLKQIQEINLAADLYVEGHSLLQMSGQKGAWEGLFAGFAKENSDLGWQLTLEKYFPRGWNHLGPEPQSCEDIFGARLGKRQLSADIKKILFDKQGVFQRDPTLSGRSLTNFYPKQAPLFYFKKYPELPAYEYAATLFMRQLGIQDAPHSELLAFYNKQEGLYPVLLTQAVAGEPVFKVWDNDSNFSQLDSYSTGLLILASMLLNPEDSKEDNFILTPDRKHLIPIDNDHVFLPGAIETKGALGFTIYPELQTKTLAFCLPAMYAPFDEKLITHIASLSIDAFLERWIKELQKVNNLYQQIIPEKELGSLWAKHGSSLRLPLSSLYIEGLYKKFYLLRSLLVQNRNLKPIDLLQRLEPYVGRFYKDVSSLPTLQARFKEVSKIYKEEKNKAARVSIANSRRLMQIMHIPKEELIGNANQSKQGPAAALKQLKKLQKDKVIQETRLEELLKISIEEGNIARAPLRDEEILIRQWFGTEQPYDWIQLPYSEQLQYKHLTSFNFQNKGHLLKVLDLRGAKQMREWDFMALHTYCPNLQYLNISECKIKRLGCFKQVGGLFGTSLELILEPIFPCLQRLVVSGCKALTEIKLYLSSLKVLEAVENTKLIKFWLESTNLKLLDLTGHQIGQDFYFSPDLITSLVLKGIQMSANKKLIIAQIASVNNKVDLSNEKLSYSDLNFLLNHSGFKVNIQNLDLSYNEIGDSGANKLAEVLPQTQIHTLDLSYNEIGDSGALKLAEVLPNRQIYRLDLSANQIGTSGANKLAEALPHSQIHTLNLEQNQIGASGVNKLAEVLPKTQIHTLDLSDNQIGDLGTIKLIEVLPKTQIHTLDLRGNQIWVWSLDELKLAEFLPHTHLHTLGLSSNQIRDSGALKLAEVLPNTQIHTLNLSFNQIGDPGAFKLAEVLPQTQIHTLDLSWNQIGDSGAFKLSEVLPNTQIHTLYLRFNQINDEMQRLLKQQNPNIKFYF